MGGRLSKVENSLPALNGFPLFKMGQIKHGWLKGGPEYFLRNLLLIALLAWFWSVLALSSRTLSLKIFLPQTYPYFGGGTKSLLYWSDAGAFGGFLDRMHLRKFLLYPLTTTSTISLSLFRIN